MKTKHILTALALPAIFAACTAEDVVVSENSNIQVERAKLSENFKLKVNGDGADSRYAVNNGKVTYHTGDRIGAFIIDQKDPTKDMAEWPVIDVWASNVPFKYNQADWTWNTPEGMWVNEGHNFFKYPYNENDKKRGAVYFEMPTIQNQYTSVNGAIDNEAPYSLGNMAIAVALLEADDEELDIDLKNIFTYPKFRIQFDNGEKVNTVSKVVIFKADGSGKPVDDGFIVKSGFKHEVVANLFKDPETDWNKVETEDLIWDAEQTFLKDFEEETYLIAQMPNNAKVQLNSNTSNKYIDVRFVLPAQKQYEEEALGMYVYTDNGMYWIKNVQDYIQFKDTTDQETKDKVLARSKSYNLTLQAVDEDELQPEAEMIVSNNADWNQLVNVYGGVKGGAYSILVVGDEFGFDATTKMPSKAKFTIVGDATVKGEATLSNVEVSGDINVAEGAKLTTSTSFEVGTINNEGTVVFAAAYDDDNEPVACEQVTKVVNDGTLIVEEDAIAAFELTNGEDATFTNEGEVEIEGGSSEGKIINNGEIEIDGAFEVKSNVEDGEELSVVENNGKILASDEFENNAKIINDGTITCRHHAGEIINNGLIVSEEDAVTYITENENGTIEVFETDLEDYVTVEAADKGTILYAAKGTVDFTNSIINTVEAVDDLNITNLGNVTEVTVTEDSKVQINGTLDNLNVEARMNLGSNVTVKNLVVAKKAVVHIPASYTLYVNSSLENNGTINAYGVLNLIAAGIAEGDEIGKVEENGSDGEVKYYSSRKSDIQQALREYLADHDNGYKNDGYKITKESFSAHLNRIELLGLEEDYPEGAECLKYVSTLTPDELAEAAATMYTANETTSLMDNLKAWDMGKNATLFETKAKAYEAYKTAVKAHAWANNTTYSEEDYYNVTNLTTEQIDAVLAENNKFAYIWNGCDFYGLVAVWVKYAGLTALPTDFNSALSGHTVGMDSLRDFMLSIKNGSSATSKEIQGLISDWTILDLNKLEYTDDQVKACAGVVYFSLNGSNPVW